MAKKKYSNAEDITEKDILSLYESVLPLQYNNPTNIDPPVHLNRCLLPIVDYDFFHYMMDDPYEPIEKGKIKAAFERWLDPYQTTAFTNITTNPVSSNNPDVVFKEEVEKNYHDVISKMRERTARANKLYYYRIESKEEPRVMMGFFRYCIKGNEDFSKSEIDILKKLSPHIFLLLRTVLLQTMRSNPFQYFDSYINICKKVAQKYELSGAESKLLSEILFGYSNEEIAERNFISLATVKKHIQHIFKKTEVKNRIDFIGKFFTSPERVEL